MSGSSMMKVVMMAMTALATARAQCDDIDKYLDIPNPLTRDTVINLDGVDTIRCPEFDPDDANMEILTVAGAKLTLQSSTSVRFVDIGFTVKPGADLIFDMPTTNFGPNTPASHRSSRRDSTVTIEDGGYVGFYGELVAKEVFNVWSIFNNTGSLELARDAVFEENSNIFRINKGVVKFRGNASFKNNKYLVISNEDSAFVRFSKNAYFEDNAQLFDGAWGCSVSNNDPNTRVIFRRNLTVKNDRCSEGAAVYNEGTMKVYGKAVFEGNDEAFHNFRGKTHFKRAVQVINRERPAQGLIVRGGDVAFNRGVRFTMSKSTDEDADFNLGQSGTMTFRRPMMVYSKSRDCLAGRVEEGSTLVGTPHQELCAS